MKIQAINNTQNKVNTNFKAINIKAIDNKHKQYLYNEVVDMVNKHHIPSLFGPEEIILNTNAKKTLEKLNKMNIKYTHFEK